MPSLESSDISCAGRLRCQLTDKREPFFFWLNRPKQNAMKRVPDLISAPILAMSGSPLLWPTQHCPARSEKVFIIDTTNSR